MNYYLHALPFHLGIAGRFRRRMASTLEHGPQGFFARFLRTLAPHEITVLHNLLSRGNRELFMDIYPVLVAYAQEGIEAIRRVVPTLNEQVVKAIEQIEKGRVALAKAPTEAKEREARETIWEGHKALLRYEQQVFLQQRVYNKGDPALWQKISPAIYLRFDINDYAPDDDKWTFFYDVTDRNEIHLFDERWAWIEREVLPLWQRRLENNGWSTVGDLVQMRDRAMDVLEPLLPWGENEKSTWHQFF